MAKFEASCPYCDKSCQRTGDNATSFDNGGVITCPYQGCGKRWAQTNCPQCDKRMFRKGDNPKSFNIGQPSQCPYESCEAHFCQTDCAYCRKIIVRTSKKSFNDGATISCPYESCLQKFAQLRCTHCESVTVRKHWPYSFSFTDQVNCSSCSRVLTPPSAPKTDGSISLAITPFSAGAFREAYTAEVKGGTVAGFQQGTKLVLKAMKSSAFNAGSRIVDVDFAMQDMVIKLAKEFNAQVCPTKGDNSCFLHVRPSRMFTMPEDKSRDGKCILRKGERVALEQFINGDYEKFNSNTGWSCGTATLPDAFSHWTWVHTNGDLLVCDLQGHRGAPGGPKFGDEEYYYLLTDPAIVSRDQRFGDTDLGASGIRGWFWEHKCNSMCDSLGLTSNRPSISRPKAARRRTSFNWE